MNESICSSTLSLNEKEKSNTLKNAWNSVCSLTRSIIEPLPEKEVIFYKPASSDGHSPIPGRHFGSSEQSLVSDDSHQFQNWNPNSTFVRYSPTVNRKYLQSGHSDEMGWPEMSFDEVSESAVKIHGLTSSIPLLKNIDHTICGRNNSLSTGIQTDSILLLDIGVETDRVVLLNKEVDATVDSATKATQTEQRKKKKWYRLFV